VLPFLKALTHKGVSHGTGTACGQATRGDAGSSGKPGEIDGAGQRTGTAKAASGSGRHPYPKSGVALKAAGHEPRESEMEMRKIARIGKQSGLRGWGKC